MNSDDLRNHPNAREAENRLLADMGIRGGQGREPARVARDASVAWWLIVIVVAIVLL